MLQSGGRLELFDYRPPAIFRFVCCEETEVPVQHDSWLASLDNQGSHRHRPFVQHEEVSIDLFFAFPSQLLTPYFERAASRISTDVSVLVHS